MTGFNRRATLRPRLPEDLRYLGLVLLQVCLGTAIDAQDNLDEVIGTMLDEVQEDAGVKVRLAIEHCFTTDFTSRPNMKTTSGAFMEDYLSKVVKPLMIESTPTSVFTDCWLK